MELLSRMTLVDAAAGSLPLDMVIEKAIRQAMLAGAAPENAAMIVATLAYFTGSCARSGVPREQETRGQLRGCMQWPRGRVQLPSRQESLPIKFLHSLHTWQSNSEFMDKKLKPGWMGRSFRHSSQVGR